MSFTLNQVIGNYECLGVIEKPKAGVTYKVRNRTTGEIELLRTLPGSSSGDSEAAARLLREIRIQTRLSHPNIVEFHDAFELDGRLVMTTEFVEAPTLAERCRGGALEPSQAVSIMIQVLDGLEQAHALGIVHRGITAEHVAVERNGAVKLSGFDLAKPSGDTNLTRVGAVPGDPRYISPEQVMGKPVLDGRADLYSVGILFFLALTGKLPFDGINDIEIWAAQVGSQPAAPSSMNPAVSTALDAVVFKALQKDPNQRFATAKEFRAALAAVDFPAMAAPVTVSAPEPPAMEIPGQPAHSRFRLSLVVGIAAAIGVAIWFAVH